MRRLIAACLAAGALVMAAPAIPASAATPKPLCYVDQLYRVTNYLHENLIIRNDDFAGGHTCIQPRGHQWSSFTVTKFTNTQTVTGAYPNIFYGCSYGKCSQGTVLPRLVTRVLGTTSTWETLRTRPAGLWNKGYDIWFSRHRHVGGQAGGAELMIWLDTTFGRPSSTPVRIAGRRYWFGWHRACNQAAHLCWNFMIFRRVSPTSSVRNLAIGPFIRFAMAHHLISSSWYMENIEAGFEMWHGGLGLGTKRFGVTVRS